MRSLCLIDTNEFLRREWVMRAGMQVERHSMEPENEASASGSL